MDKVLRACINLGNPILAQRDGASGEVNGLTVDLAHAFAERQGAELDLLVVLAGARATSLFSCAS